MEIMLANGVVVAENLEHSIEELWQMLNQVDVRHGVQHTDPGHEELHAILR